MMKTKTILSAVTLAAMVAASFSSIANAEMGPRGGDRGAMMPAFEEMDANGDGKVTKEEIATFRAAQIAALDTDKDGNLSEAELIAGKKMREDAREAKMAKRMIERQDTNKDGVLSVEEMAGPADRGDRMFDRIDTDDDGAISKAEADAAKEKMGKRGGKGKHKHKRGDRDDN